MFLDSEQLRAMQAGMKATQMKQQVIAHNISNYETPNYKAKSVSFKEVYNNALKDGGDGRYRYDAVVTTRTDTEIRTDGNNVDMDKENLELYENYVQSVTLYQKIGGEYSKYRYVLSNFAK
ncbi:MAG: flagellar basal body rod protein FlgB [Oscillospiraceae bacterium]|nr:flagellar basal body rod protein FlgB [Oscillospiraceae bacterium]